MTHSRRRSLYIAQTGAFAALLTAGSWISVPFIPVPLTLQTFFVMLAGGVMGRYAALPVFLYLAMGTMNLPVFHNGTAGLGVLLGPTGGYLIGFLPGALLSGLGFEGRSAIRQCAGLTAGLAALFGCGMAWLSVSSGLSWQAAFILGVLPFIPGDILKASVVFLVSRRLAAIRETRGIKLPRRSEEGDS